MIRSCETCNKLPVEKLFQAEDPFLARILNLLNSDLDTSQVVQRVVAAIRQVMEVHCCSITMVREDNRVGSVMASSADIDLVGY